MWKQRVYFSAMLALGVMASAAVAGTSSGVDLSGTWVLNQKLSDDPQAMWKQHNGSGGGGGHHGGGGGYSGGGGGSYGGHHGGGGVGGGPDPAHQHSGDFAPAQKLTIIESGDKVVMIPEGRDSVVVIPDGKEHERQTPAGVAKVEASWTDVALQVKMTSPTGNEATRLYRINSDGRLEVVTQLPAPPNSNQKPLEIVMRYDEAPATKSTAAPAKSN